MIKYLIIFQKKAFYKYIPNLYNPKRMGGQSTKPISKNKLYALRS